MALPQATGFEYAVAEECRSVDVSLYSSRIDPYVACDNATGDPVGDSGVLRPRTLYAGFEDFTTIDMPVQTVSPPRSLRLLTCDDPELKKLNLKSDASTSTTIDVRRDSFQNLTSLEYLRIEGFQFLDPNVVLNVSSTLQTIDLWMNNVANLSLLLPRNRVSSLRDFRLMENAFATLPAVLYERRYAKVDTLSLTITPEPSKHILSLSAEQYENAKANLAAFTSAANNTAAFAHGNETSLVVFGGDCERVSGAAFSGALVVCSGEALSTPSRPPTVIAGQSSKSSLPTILIGVSIAIVVIFCSVLVWWRRRRARQPQQKSETDSSGGDFIAADNAPSMESTDQFWKPPALQHNTSSSERRVYHVHFKKSRAEQQLLVDVSDDTIAALRLPMHELSVSQLLSRGTFGEVFLGHFHGRRVAVKRLAPDRRRDEFERSGFLSEAKLMAALQHERIIQFVGVAWDDPLDVHVVTEFMDGGDLRTLLQTFDAERRPVGFDACKLRIARHVIEGLAYLHSLEPAVLHRDLKSRNVLLSADAQCAKLIDFGVSRLRADHNSTMTTCVGTLRWMAPEVMVGGRYGESADVFSFGVVLSELDTHEIPYNLLPEGAVVVHVYEGTLQVRFHRESDVEVVRLARDCMAYEPEQRPSAREVAQRLETIWRSSYAAVTAIVGENALESLE